MVLGQRGAREVAVGLARDQARRARRPRAAPVASHSQWSALRTTSGCGSGTRPAYWMPSSCCSGPVDLAPERGLAGAAALAAGQQPVGDAGRRRAQLDLPVHGVGGEEDERGAAVAGALDGAAHRRPTSTRRGRGRPGRGSGWGRRGRRAGRGRRRRRGRSRSARPSG